MLAEPQHQDRFSVLVRVSRRRRYRVFPHVVVSQDLRMRRRVTIEARYGNLDRNCGRARIGRQEKAQMVGDLARIHGDDGRFGPVRDARKKCSPVIGRTF